MSKDIIRVGNVSVGNSQAGSVYGSWGAFPTLCAGTHGYAMGYIVVKKKRERNIKQPKRKHE